MARTPGKSTRRSVLAALAVAPLWALAGCGGGGGGATAAQVAELNQPVTVEFLSRQPYEDSFELAIQRFRSRFPKAEVRRDQQANNNAFNQKLETLVAAGTPPDVAFAVGSTYHGQAAQGFYEDLTPYTARDKSLNVEDVIPFWLEAGKFRGKLYFLPFDPGTTVVFWNKRLFTSSGVKAPDTKQPMTWPQLLEVARQLTRVPPAVPENQMQFGFEPMSDRIWYLLPWQMGVEVFDFVKHLSDAEVYETLLEKGVMQPVRKSQQNSPAYRKNSPPYSFDVPLEDTKTARTPPFHPSMGELPTMITNALADAFAGKTAVKPLVEQLVPLVNQKLAEYNARFPVK